MRVERALERLGGVATTRELRRHCPRARIRLALGNGRIVRDARGRYSLPDTDEALRAANRLSGVLFLDSAARYHGWKTKVRPESPAVAVPRNRKLASDRRAGARVVYVDLSPAQILGRATGFVRTVMDCASRMPTRYRARCLRVAEEASGLADNPFESVLRAIALDVPGLAVRPQVWIGDIGRADLGDRVLRLAVEAEFFEFHGLRRLLKRDCDGWLVIRFAWEHVMFEPEYVANVLRSAVMLLTGRSDGRALAAPRSRLTA